MSCFCAGHQQNVCARYILYLEFSVGDTFCIFNSLLVIHFLFAFCVGDTFCIFAVSVYTLFPYPYFTESTFTKLRFAVMISNELLNFSSVQKSISRAFGSSLCLKVLLVGSSVVAIVPSQWLLAAHHPGVARLENTQLRLGC